MYFLRIISFLVTPVSVVGAILLASVAMMFFIIAQYGAGMAIMTALIAFVIWLVFEYIPDFMTKRAMEKFKSMNGT